MIHYISSSILALIRWISWIININWSSLSLWIFSIVRIIISFISSWSINIILLSSIKIRMIRFTCYILQSIRLILDPILIQILLLKITSISNGIVKIILISCRNLIIISIHNGSSLRGRSALIESAT